MYLLKISNVIKYHIIKNFFKSQGIFVDFTINIVKMAEG